MNDENCEINAFVLDDSFFTWSGDEIMTEEIQQVILKETNAVAWNCENVEF